MEGLKVTFGEALRGKMPVVEAPQSAEPDRAFVEGIDQKLVKLHRQHPSLHKRIPVLRAVASPGKSEPPPAPESSPSPPTEVLPEAEMPKPAKRGRGVPIPPETKRAVLELIEGGVSQKEAAKAHGVGQSAVSRWAQEAAKSRKRAARQSPTERRETTLLSRPQPPKRGLEVVAKELAEATARVEALKAEMRKLLGDA